MKVVFDDEVLDDLQRIFAEIAQDNPRAAGDLVGRIFDKAERLATPELAHMGRPGLDPGTRELIEYPYILVYEVFEDRGMSWCFLSFTAREIGSSGQGRVEDACCEEASRRWS